MRAQIKIALSYIISIRNFNGRFRFLLCYFTFTPHLRGKTYKSLFSLGVKTGQFF